MSQWKYVKPSATMNDIKTFETLVDIDLPKDIQAFLLSHNGGRPPAKAFDTTQTKGRVFNKLLSLSKTDQENVFSFQEILSGELPRHLIAIALDPFGNMICLDKQDSLNVVFWEHETHASETTNKSLLALVKSLY